MSCEDEKECFTISWKIENFDILLRADGGLLTSPAWKTDATEGSEMWLLVNNFESSIGFRIKCSNQTWKPDRLEASVISSCGKIIPISNNFSCCLFAYFNIHKNNMFVNNVSPKRLTIECKMWRNSMKKGGFRIHSVLKKVHFWWCPVEHPCFSPSSGPYSHNEIIERDDFRINVSLNRESQNDQYYICAQALPILDGCFSFVKWDIVCDSMNVASVRGTGREDYNDLRTEYIEGWRIVIKRGVTCDASCRFSLLMDTIVAHHSYCQCQIAQPAASQIIKAEGIADADPLTEDLLQLYRESILSDATINTKGKSFSAHRSILAARSPVFRAMFEKDEMSEGRSGVVDIDDVDSETLGRMLVFLYSDSLNGLQWGEAASLYYAADKYAVQPLKQKCVDILKAGLTVDNLCDALVLADTHSDEHLMKCAVDFIDDHQEVVLSPKFVQLEDIKPRLTLKVTKELFLKRKK